MNDNFAIDPASVAFDIDGVFADTMTLFIDIARDEHDIGEIKYEDITCYQLEDCLDIDTAIIRDIITKLLDGTYAAPLNAIEGASEVLTRLGGEYRPLLFVTARPYPGPINDWIQNTLPLDSNSIEVVTTGSFEAKADELLRRGISYFVEDRLETCFALRDAGITPVLFKQPWNRASHPFVEVGSWSELDALIDF